MPSQSPGLKLYLYIFKHRKARVLLASLATALPFVKILSAPAAKSPAVLGADHLVGKRKIHLFSHVIVKVYLPPAVSFIIYFPARFLFLFRLRRRKNEFYLKIRINAYVA